MTQCWYSIGYGLRCSATAFGLVIDFRHVDLLNNLDGLAEDREAVLRQAQGRLSLLDPARLQRAVDGYGGVAMRKLLRDRTDRSDPL
ncbi:MAG: hypothetical protein AB7L90_26740 [Hyphomicrobiaceae bacterium]